MIPRINEVFGPTFQGEGPATGRRCSFIRFALCNLTCVWCDTPYTWDWNGRNGHPFSKTNEVHPRTVGDLLDEIRPHMTSLVILTGGEPLVQATAHAELLLELIGAGYEVHTETNGTLIPHDTIAGTDARWSVSPKLSSAGMPRDKRIVPAAIDWFAANGKASFKFVVGGPSDVEEAVGIVNAYQIPRSRVWFMPEGVTARAIDTALPKVAAAALDAGVNLSTRLHVSTWGDTRGV